MAGKGQEYGFGVFPVAEKPYCLWGWDLRSENLKFLQGIAYDHFAYIAAVHEPQLEGEHRQNAAIALRAAFHHGLETLFSLLGAAVQAPGSVAAWILKCDTEKLRQFVANVNTGTRLPNFVGLDHVSWSGVAEKVLTANFASEEEAFTVKSRFADLWARLAQEYLQQAHIDEYNSLKHGFRTRPGGFTMQVANESTNAGKQGPGSWHTISTSEFGSSFLRPKPITGAPPVKKHERDPHLQLETHSLNWDPHNMASALRLISLSIGNICGSLRWLGGESRDTLPRFFAPPSDPLPALRYAPGGIRKLVVNRDVTEQHIERYSPDQLMSKIEAAAESCRTAKQKAGSDLES